MINVVRCSLGGFRKFLARLVFVCVAASRRFMRCQLPLWRDTANFMKRSTTSLYHRRLLTKLCCFTTIASSVVAGKLTVEEEEQWDAKEASIHENELSDSGKESEEHDSDDVNFYTDSEEDNEDEERESEKMISKRVMMRRDKKLNSTGKTIRTEMFVQLKNWNMKLRPCALTLTTI
jgi:hypothetical protein